jgi:CheY-like chemotaxis protein
MIDVDTLEPVHILLVEDNPNDVEITTRALRIGQIRNRLTVAMDGQEALEILDQFKASADCPGLILLDLNLPKVDGIEVLKRIKSDPATRRIPVIVLTTSTNQEDVISAYDFGVNTFITKPVRFEDFMQAVQTIHEYWSRLATLPRTVGV